MYICINKYPRIYNFEKKKDYNNLILRLETNSKKEKSLRFTETKHWTNYHPSQSSSKNPEHIHLSLSQSGEKRLSNIYNSTKE